MSLFVFGVFEFRDEVGLLADSSEEDEVVEASSGGVGGDRRVFDSSKSMLMYSSGFLGSGGRGYSCMLGRVGRFFRDRRVGRIVR